MAPDELRSGTRAENGTGPSKRTTQVRSSGATGGGGGGVRRRGGERFEVGRRTRRRADDHPGSGTSNAVPPPVAARSELGLASRDRQSHCKDHGGHRQPLRIGSPSPGWVESVTAAVRSTAFLIPFAG